MMTTKKQTDAFPDAVLEGLRQQIRKLEMQEKRQSEALENTKTSLKALREIIGEGRDT